MISGHLTTDLTTIGTMMYDLTDRLNTVRRDSEDIYETTEQVMENQRSQEAVLSQSLASMIQDYNIGANHDLDHVDNDDGVETETEWETASEIKAQEAQEAQGRQLLLSQLESENLSLTIQLQRYQEMQDRLTSTVSQFESALESIVSGARRREIAHDRILTRLTNSYKQRNLVEREAQEQLRGDGDLLSGHLRVVDIIGNNAVNHLGEALSGLNKSSDHTIAKDKL
ncbi:hypothetical protein NADFUDRAFT_52712 [Nadsonia fulvescens var. elongata DSM 6958]|uniref:Uncharacterized protein n=1 Tax=Nadsonia fulvescens var. elongata DSM 6958 TaxID=857566 RepID=A0A1E3PG38_9ASCO|nr:hypothetical protein NADFUDRAFT_52712 [Nadsonia fulvescens var. elongata DSM 6958]